MRNPRMVMALAVTLGLYTSLPASAEPAAAPDADIANHLFEAGKFAEAGEIYAKLAAQSPKDEAAVLQLGRIALLANHLDEAEQRFGQVLALQPQNTDAKVMLAEAYYRGDDFEHAAASLGGVDVGNNQLILSQYPTLNVAKLESFKGETPYELPQDWQSTRVPFLKSEPLPLVSVRINGGAEVTFFIDTGGSEVLLDSDFAKELGLPNFGMVQGTFSGGQHAQVGQSRIGSLGLGDLTIKNLPAVTMKLRQLSSGFGVRELDGCIGTTLLYHFLATLDYPNGALILRRKAPENLAQFEAGASPKAVVPIRMASDHFMVGFGRIETLPPSLLFVDTGLAGAGVKLAESVIKQAGITLEEDKATSGAGGGGTLKIVPYSVKHLSFGDIEETDVAGLYDGPFPWETSFGFDLAGMVGHDFFKPYAVTFDFDGMRIFMQ